MVLTNGKYALFFVGIHYERMLKMEHAYSPIHQRIKSPGTNASNQFKLVVIGLPNVQTTRLIYRLLNKPFHISSQTKRFKVYHCTVNTETFDWREEDVNYQLSKQSESCVRAVIFELIATEIILELLYLLVSPEDIILLVYDQLSSCMANIDYILNFISSRCSTECCSSALHCPHFPAVLMVKFFTESSARHPLDINILHRHCHGKTYEKHLLEQDKDAFHLFKIDDNILSLLKMNISTVAKSIYDQYCPTMYSQFEKSILELYESRSCLTKVEATRIADQAGIQTIEPLLEHYRNKGIILYYPNLKEKIFISPQRIINLIASVFELPDVSLQESLLEHSPKERKLLIYLLVNFGLAVPVHGSISQSSKTSFCYEGATYIIPLLAHNVAIRKLKPGSYIGVLYHLPDAFLPKYVFYQLVIKLIDWFHDHTDENTVNW